MAAFDVNPIGVAVSTQPVTRFQEIQAERRLRTERLSDKAQQDLVLQTPNLDNRALTELQINSPDLFLAQLFAQDSLTTTSTTADNSLFPSATLSTAALTQPGVASAFDTLQARFAFFPQYTRLGVPLIQNFLV